MSSEQTPTAASARERRLASGDPMKRLTYKYQWYLALARNHAGLASDSEHARYIRRELRRVRGLPF